MRLNLYIERDAPPLPWPSELVELDTSSIPYLLGALFLKEQKFHWTDDEQARLGRSMLCKQGAQMLLGAADRIIESIDRLYRLTDSIHNGTVYAVDGEGTTLDPYVYYPSMPLVPATESGAEPSVKFSLEKVLRLQDNLVNGTTYTDAPDDRNLRQQLEDILTALDAEGSLDPEMLAKLGEIALALA